MSFGDSGARLVASLNIKNQKIIDACVIRMTSLMEKLQEKARANAPKLTGALEESISNPRAEAQGKKIIGTVDWGGGASAPYAQAQEIGGKGVYAINPKEAVGAYRGGKPFGKEVAAHPAIPAKKALHFIGRDGKDVFAAYVFHPPQTAKWFMRDALYEMKEEIIEGLQRTIGMVLSRREE